MNGKLSGQKVERLAMNNSCWANTVNKRPCHNRVKEDNLCAFHSNARKRFEKNIKLFGRPNWWLGYRKDVLEVECPCCKEWYVPCGDPEHTNEAKMCAFCATGQHDLTAACRPD
jgi:hypothetical protein